jgi:Tol biopolymer transport system component
MKLKSFRKYFYLSSLLLIINCYTSPPLPVSRASGQLLPGASATALPSPTPSPDRSEKIAFMSNRSGFWDIYTMNPDGSEQVKLTSDDMKGPFAFSVSPDGKKLAYISDKSGNPDLWVMDLQSKETVQLTHTELADEGSPGWSPDSSNIVFHANSATDGLYRALQVSYPLVNGHPDFRELLSRENMNILHPAYAPDGSRLLYSLADENGAAALHIYDFLDKSDSPLTKADDQAVNGSWSPDSKKIIYWTASDGLFQINPDGTGAEPLGTIKNIKGTPFFSPDGSRIVISRGAGFAEDYDVWVINRDGRNPVKLTTLGGLSLAWFKTGNSPAVYLPDPSPSFSASGAPYLDPGDPLLNP